MSDGFALFILIFRLSFLGVSGGYSQFFIFGGKGADHVYFVCAGPVPAGHR